MITTLTRTVRNNVLFLISSFFLVACGGGGSSGPKTYSLSGTLTGLANNSQVELSSGNDLIANITLTKNGAFSFTSKLETSSAYDVNVVAVTNPNQDGQQSCTVNNGQGTITGNTNTISVNCSLTLNNYALHGTLTGLADNTELLLTEANNLVADITLNTDGNFSSQEQLEAGTTYHFIIGAVTDPHQDIWQQCTITNAQGNVTYNALPVAISCSTSVRNYAITGVLSGLAAGTELVLKESNNLIANTTLSANGEFSTQQLIEAGMDYHFAIASVSNPDEDSVQTCAVNNSQGTMSYAFSALQISCVTNPKMPQQYSIKGTVTGLAEDTDLVLMDSTENTNLSALTITENGEFEFSQTLTPGQSYNLAVTVGQGNYPEHSIMMQSCIMDSNNSGEASGVDAEITINIDCSTALYFTAATHQYGEELWKTDGTDTGTVMVKDINTTPVTNAPTRTGNSSPSLLKVLNGKLIFRASDGVNGTELWVSDGTETGTYMLKNIVSGSTSSVPTELTEFNGKLYFSANYNQLWVTDGTEAGTTLVKNTYGLSYQKPAVITVLNNKMIFRGSDGTHGNELWISDGTSEGTHLLKDIRAGSDSSTPENLTVMGDKIYFSAIMNSSFGRELWVTDGTAEGTSQVKNINSFSNSSSNPGSLTVFNGKLYFSADDTTHATELWVSDGTNAGTTLVKDIFQGNGINTSWPSNLTVFNNKLYFSANTANVGYNLWVSNGTNGGTYIAGFIPQPNSFKVIGDYMYFKSLITGHTDRYYLNSMPLSGSTKQIQTQGDIIGLIDNWIYIIFSYQDSVTDKTITELRRSEVNSSEFETFKTLQ